METKQFILNLGSGAVDSARYNHGWFTVHVDGCYRESIGLTPEQIEQDMGKAIIAAKITDPTKMSKQYPCQLFCRSDIFEFVERFPFKFNHVYAERIFEHMEYVGGEIGRLLEGINRITKPEAQLEIVVPNMALIAEMIIDYEKNADKMSINKQLNTKLIINTEAQNCRCDPHLSSWTPRLAKEYIESEGTWKIMNTTDQMKFTGRDIYMKVVCKKT